MSETGGKARLRYAVIGAGMSGVMAAIKLLQRGDADFAVFEKGAELGGTWRDNRYPGLTCDTPSHAYSYSFALNPDWSAYYATGPEIHAYFKGVAERFGVVPYIRFNSEVTSCTFDDATRTWTLGIVDGSTYEADVVIVATGVLHHPKMPDLPGLDTFKGKAFHSARWDDSAVLDGARVGVIGCGSTGIQIVNALSSRAAKLVHFQRSPQWIMPVVQFEYTAEQRAAFAADPSLIEAIRNDPQYWEAVYRFTEGVTDFTSPQMHEIEELCRQNLEQSVRDPELREKLRPDYHAACKRLIYSWEYYECVQRPGVSVEVGAIERIVPEGVLMKDGTLHELDVLVLATGFRADSFIRPAVVTGRGGRSLDEFWATRPTAHYAIAMPDFPNFFMLNGPNGPVGNFSLIEVAELQCDYVLKLIDEVRRGACRELAPTREAMARFDAERREAATKTIWNTGCKSWYLDETGLPTAWPFTFDRFRQEMGTPRLDDYERR